MLWTRQAVKYSFYFDCFNHITSINAVVQYDYVKQYKIKCHRLAVGGKLGIQYTLNIQAKQYATQT